ncbi:MAG: radical SAM protein [Myxococcota bacterium]
MRSARLLTNETCDLRCSFCDARRDHERASVAGAQAIAASLADTEGAEEVIVTGGEPTLRRDLPAVIRAAARGGATVVLETNAWRITDEAAQRLARAGLATARVHVPEVGARADRVTGGHDVWPGLARGIAALRDAGITVEVAIPIVADNAERAGEIPGDLEAAGIIPSRISIRVPLRAPEPSTLASREAIAAGIEAIADAARRRQIPATLDPATFVPPCQVPRPARIAHLYRLNPGGSNRTGYERARECSDCRIADRCPGLPTDAPHFRDAAPRPIDSDRTRRRLTLIDSVQVQVDRELVTHEVYRRPDGTTAEAHVIRINFRCNQACSFCFVSTHLPAADEGRVESAIVAAASRGAIVVLSGGEPTLNPKLTDWIALATREGAPEVELQTNATLLDEDRAKSLATAGLSRAFVSLHAATPECSDAITGAPGTFADTLVGLDALAAAGVAVRINYVLCRPNAEEFPAFVNLVAARWPHAAITVSFVGMSTDLVPRTRALVPRYREVMPALTEGVRRAGVHGIEVEGFDSMCGIPLCLAPVPSEHFASLAAPPADYDGGEFVHPPPCRACSLQTRCFGLRRGYADLYGWDELRPL